MTDDEIKALALKHCDNNIEFARAIIAAHTAKLLAGVEMPEPIIMGYEEVDWDDFQPVFGFAKDQLQQYAAAAAAQARVKALDEAKRVCVGVAEITKASGSWALDAQNCATVIEKLKGGE